MARVEVVVVTYDSAATVRDCVVPLTRDPEISVIIVDNASQDETLQMLSDLPLRVIARGVNDGFGAGCNVGWRAGEASSVVFLNPDSQADAESILALAECLESDHQIGVLGPQLVDVDGNVQHSQRRFPSFRTSLAAAFFISRIRPTTAWSLDIADAASYRSVGSPDWVSGACLAIRRDVLEALGGFDEEFFMYHEDMDLCRRVRDLGFDVRYEPSIRIVHIGGASRPRVQLIAVKARSAVMYGRKHGGRHGELVARLGTAVHALTHSVMTTQGMEARRGYLRALAMCIGGSLPARKR